MAPTAFLACAQVAEELIASDVAAERWREPSALTGYTVGGLAGHLARAVLTLDGYLDEPAPAVEPTDAAGYYLRVLAAHDPVSSDCACGGRARMRPPTARRRWRHACATRGTP
jgi:hypothetical protein